MTSRILLTGGTGGLGRLVAPLLLATGADVRVLSRAASTPDGYGDGTTRVRGDLATGEGIEAAVAGVDTIVHCAGNQKGDDALTGTLVRAARAAGSPHLVHISVVGCDRIPVRSAVDRTMFGYFASKRAAEVVVAESGLQWTTLRASQFHELALTTVAALGRLPVVPYFSGVAFQPVAAVEVAERLVELALGSPAGLVPDIGGPEVHAMRDLVRTYLLAVGRRRATVPLRAFGGAARAIRAGANLAPERAVGRQTWAAFLDERVSAQAHLRMPSGWASRPVQ